MARTCSPGNKKFAKMVDGKCVRFGDPNMTIKKINLDVKKVSVLDIVVVKKQ